MVSKCQYQRSDDPGLGRANSTALAGAEIKVAQDFLIYFCQIFHIENLRHITPAKM